MNHPYQAGEAIPLLQPRANRPAASVQVLKRCSEQGGFAEGDQVTRDGTDIHVVRNMTSDGMCADFECVRAPADGWAAVGEVEYNLCRRYTRVRPASGLAARKGCA